MVRSGDHHRAFRREAFRGSPGNLAAHVSLADEDFGPVAVISRGQTAQLFTEYRRPGHIFLRSLAVLHGIFPECLMTAFSALGIQQPVYVAGALFL